MTTSKKPKRYPFRMCVRIPRPKQEDLVRSFTVNATGPTDAMALAGVVGTVLEKRIGPRKTKALAMKIDFDLRHFDLRYTAETHENLTLEEVIVWALTVEG